jgi:hypothetical protein
MSWARGIGTSVPRDLLVPDQHHALVLARAGQLGQLGVCLFRDLPRDYVDTEDVAAPKKLAGNDVEQPRAARIFGGLPSSSSLVPFLSTK